MQKPADSGTVPEGTLEETFLPRDAAENIIVSPTLARWGTVEKHGPLVDLITSLQLRSSQEGLSDKTMMLLGDATETPDIDALRTAGLSRAANVADPAPMYIATLPQRRAIAEMMAKKTDLSRVAIRSLLEDTGYGSQRGHLRLVTAAMRLAHGSDIREATFDDDTVVPDSYHVVRPENLPPPFTNAPNSQLVYREKDVRLEDMEKRQNALAPFFRYLGMTVAELRKEFGKLPTSTVHKDTMHVALDAVRKDGVAQFVVTHDLPSDLHDDPLNLPQQSVINQKNGNGTNDVVRILSTVIAKHGRPDYRTAAIAQLYLESEFPPSELPLLSFLSGDVKPYAHAGSNTNIDSANIAFLLTDKTARVLPWFVSDTRISEANPLRSAQGQYRSDNEILPVLFSKPSIEPAFGGPSMYLSGLPTQVYHNRAAFGGHRVDTHKQATQSLIGHVAAMQAFEHMNFDATSQSIRMDAVSDKFEVPGETAFQLFMDIHRLAEICERKGKEVAGRTPKDTDEAKHLRWVCDRYKDVHTDLKRCLASFNYHEFKRHLDVEVRDQVRAFGDVLTAYPVLVEELAKLIKAGEYPVTRFVPAHEPLSVSMQS